MSTPTYDMSIGAFMTVTEDPPKSKAVIVIETDPEHLHEAIEALQRFLSAVRLNAPEDQELYGPTLHVAIEDVAEAVLKHFEPVERISDLGKQCCCRWGAAVSGEYPEFGCAKCPIHQGIAGESDTELCRRHT